MFIFKKTSYVVFLCCWSSLLLHSLPDPAWLVWSSLQRENLGFPNHGFHRRSGNCILTKILIVRRWRPGKTRRRWTGKPFHDMKFQRRVVFRAVDGCRVEKVPTERGCPEFNAIFGLITDAWICVNKVLTSQI